MYFDENTDFLELSKSVSFAVAKKHCDRDWDFGEIVKRMSKKDACAAMEWLYKNHESALSDSFFEAGPIMGFLRKHPDLLERMSFDITAEELLELEALCPGVELGFHTTSDHSIEFYRRTIHLNWDSSFEKHNPHVMQLVNEFPGRRWDFVAMSENEHVTPEFIAEHQITRGKRMRPVGVRNG